LNSIRTALFGRDPDRQMINYRLGEILPLLHATAYAEYITTYDSRITYRPGEATELFTGAFGWTASKLDADSQLTLIGELPQRTASARLVGEWDIQAIAVDAASATFRVASRRPMSPPLDVETAITDDWTEKVALTKEAGFRVQATLTVGDRWRVVRRQRPLLSVIDVLNVIATAGADAIDATLEGSDEPQVTFQKLWRQQREPVLRLAGILFAYQAKVQRLTGLTA
jgi:hypothetical protein